MLNRCIYRDFKVDSNRCKNTSLMTSPFCIYHIHIKNPIYNLICECNINDDKPFQFRDFITLYLYMYNNLMNNRYYILQNFFKNKEKLYLCLGFGFKLKDLKKNTLIIRIYEKLENYCLVFNLKATKRKIILFQRLWRKYMSKISGAILGKPINNNEIFTFDDITEIEYPFYILDNKKVYVFEALSLLYHINNNKKKYNPYTKNKITNKTIDRLYHYLYIKDLCLDDDEYQWLTTINAYTDISLELDKLGYYTDIRWFISLDYKTIVKVLNSFHKYVDDSHYMCCTDFNNEYPDYIYKFCIMILEMLKDNDASTYGFILYKSLADNSKIFNINSPNWLEI